MKRNTVTHNLNLSILQSSNLPIVVLTAQISAYDLRLNGCICDIVAGDLRHKGKMFNVSEDLIVTLVFYKALQS